MTKRQSPTDVALELLRDLENYQRSGGKQAFRKELRERFVRRSGCSSLDQTLAMAMASLIRLTNDLPQHRGSPKVRKKW
jgi:hypothetical protein